MSFGGCLLRTSRRDGGRGKGWNVRVFSLSFSRKQSSIVSFEVVGEGRLRTKNYVDVFGLVHIVVGVLT